MEPVPRPFRRPLRTFRGVGCSYFIASDAAVAVPVESQDERIRLFDELLARDIAVLVFVKIAEICLGQGDVGLLDVRELGRVELAVVVSIGRRKDPVGKALPFIAGVNAVAVGVPDRRPVFEHPVLSWLWGGLGESERRAHQKQSHYNPDPANRLSARQISLLFAAT